MNPQQPQQEIQAHFSVVTREWRRLLVLSIIVSLLLLIPTGYMLEVYGRVLNSRNPMTLLMLTLLVLAIYVVIEGLDWVRLTILHQASQRLEESLNLRVFRASFDANLQRHEAGHGQAINDLRVVKESVASHATLAVFDAPSSLIFLVLIFLIHPFMGITSVLAAIVQGLITWQTEKAVHPMMTRAAVEANAASEYAMKTLRNAAVLDAMGMRESIKQQWVAMHRRFLALQAHASDRAGSNAAVSKFIQTAQGSLLLAIGCWLTIQGFFTGGGGMLIVASILGGRALAPLVMLITAWRQISMGRAAYQRLAALLEDIPPPAKKMDLPKPAGELRVESATTGPPGGGNLILRNISFTIRAGNCVGVIGPSGAGKSTLGRLLAGAWPTQHGIVRLDGADIYSWNKEQLGPRIGYLPQDIELFDGTIAENICRFGTVDEDALRQVAGLLELDTIVDRLPGGYDSRVGDEGCFLSAGQRQRIGIARALYGSPQVIVLDEPNTNLDDEGDSLIGRALAAVKASGATLIIITHRTSLLPLMDTLLMLRDGTLAMYGPRDDVLAELSGKRPAPELAGEPA